MGGTRRGARLGRRDLAIDAQRLAVRLLGTVLVRTLPTGERLSGRIVETEAYIGVHDRGSHAFAGRRTPRNESMFARPGTAYVYFTYGMHHCMNVVCAAADDPQAVLIRALEPLEGMEQMARRRGVALPRSLTGGPARLCEALDIDRRLDGIDLCESEVLWLEAGDPPRRVSRSARIGLGVRTGAWARRRLRWYDSESPCVSVGRKTIGVRQPDATRRSGASKDHKRR